MKLFMDLTEEQESEFRVWARLNYKPYDQIDGCWHPIVQTECVRINEEANVLTEEG